MTTVCGCLTNMHPAGNDFDQSLLDMSVVGLGLFLLPLGRPSLRFPVEGAAPFSATGLLLLPLGRPGFLFGGSSGLGISSNS